MSNPTTTSKTIIRFDASGMAMTGDGAATVSRPAPAPTTKVTTPKN